MSTRRGGIPGPESRTGLVRPTMTEAEFERQQAPARGATLDDPDPDAPAADEPEPRDRDREPAPARGASSRSRGSASSASPASSSRSRGSAAKPRRVQRMFAIEEELDKKLWLYAIHVGKDRSEVVNDLLRPLVSSMVLYDSRDRRSRGAAADDGGEGDGDG